MKRFIKIALFLSMTLSLYAKDYRYNDQVIVFIDSMVRKYNFNREYLENLFKDVYVQKKSLKIISHKRTKKPSKYLQKLYPKHGSWDRYVHLKVTPKRVIEGRRFMRKYRYWLKKAERIYGVPSEYITAIIGIESAFGKNVGKYPVFDTLTTLAFEKNRRSKFYRYQLEKFLLLSYKNSFNPKHVKGSFAGAIGLCQFIPSNYEPYGVDFDKDGYVRLQTAADAIGSVAKYLYKNGWKKNSTVAVRVTYEGNRFYRYKTGYNKLYKREHLRGIRPKRRWHYHGKVRLIKLDRKKYDELWYAADNFRVLTRYNHSAYYAMSVHKLASKI